MHKNMFSLALAIATEVHFEQRDKGGKPYIQHPLRIMMRLRTDDEELMCVALLHDVIEDSNGVFTIERLRSLGISERVLMALELLTHDIEEDYHVYITRLAASFNRDAIRVKMEDLRDNSDITRMKGLRDKDFDRLIKYNRAYAYLKEHGGAR